MINSNTAQVSVAWNIDKYLMNNWKVCFISMMIWMFQRKSIGINVSVSFISIGYLEIEKWIPSKDINKQSCIKLATWFRTCSYNSDVAQNFVWLRRLSKWWFSSKESCCQGHLTFSAALQVTHLGKPVTKRYFGFHFQLFLFLHLLDDIPIGEIPMTG